ncbi:MAG: SRPBCC family protein [Cytophagales bacterium]|nr:SRPBCC family protein [Cytophagales bacterium]
MFWLLSLGLVLAIVLVYLLSLPASYTVTRKIVIAKPIAEVFAYVRDFSNWPAWSPWTLHEPSAKVALDRPTEVGGTYAWDGQKIGAGNMRHRSIQDNQRIDLLLTFLRPFKSQAEVNWSFQSAQDGTEVTWTMEAKTPLPLRLFQGFFAKMIGYDFALGLALLRGQLDPSSEHPRITFDGVVTREAQTYATEHFEGTFEAMRQAMQEAYPRLWQNISKDADRWEQKPAIAAYHQVRFMKGTTVMDMGLAVKQLTAHEQGITIPTRRYFQMTMRGSYEFLPSAWNTIHGQIKMQKLRVDKRYPALEVYQVNPMESTNSNDWVTLLCVPIK